MKLKLSARLSEHGKLPKLPRKELVVAKLKAGSAEVGKRAQANLGKIAESQARWGGKSSKHVRKEIEREGPAASRSMTAARAKVEEERRIKRGRVG